MKYFREIVHHPTGGNKLQISERILNAPPFKEAGFKQGGYGKLGPDFWLQRIADRGFHAIVITLSGKGKITMEDGQSIIVSEGDAFISWSNGQGHREETAGDEPWEMLWFTIWESSRIFIADSSDWYVRTCSNIELLKKIWLALFSEDIYNDRLTPPALGHWEQLFIINIKRSLGWDEDIRTSRYRQSLSLLWEKVLKDIGRTWDLDELANEVNMSRSHLSRISKEIYGISPGEMVRDLKMKEAKLQLINSDRQISEIAETVGYQRLSTFSYAFTQKFGITPSAFRLTPRE